MVSLGADVHTYYNNVQINDICIILLASPKNARMKKSQDLDGKGTQCYHNFSVMALPLSDQALGNKVIGS